MAQKDQPQNITNEGFELDFEWKNEKNQRDIESFKKAARDCISTI